MENVSKYGIFSVGPKPGKRKVLVRIGKGRSRVTLEFVSRSERAIEGPCVLIAERNTFFGGEQSKRFVSRVMRDPTWGQVFAQFKRSIPVTRDVHHVYLEGVHKGSDLNGVPVYYFSTGS